ncbi:MAG: sigma-70 region 4 domain-containing protein [Candidatus Nanoarchaeia archaeon]|nr:sigma-70 region 4 domain-containing protein [Candidatus Nanoarchaeia archaeon]MDD5587857.1 sigma-70 region 4 domain-containing protein [Candidatus Nanoarchaeia archaeon]
MLSWLFKKVGVQGDQVKLDTKLHESFSNIKIDIKEIGNWINHFKQKHDENDEKHENHEKNIMHLSRRISAIEDKLENLSVQSFMNVHERSAEIGLNEATPSNSGSQLFMNVQSFMNVQTIEKLTPAQKNILGLLVYAGGPLGYDDISKKLGLSIVTVRRHINDIKKVGFKLEEKNSAKGRKKLFYFGEKEKRAILKEAK